MKRKKQILKFLEDNYFMINGLMSEKERLAFNGDVVSVIEKEIKRQIANDEELKIEEVR